MIQHNKSDREPEPELDEIARLLDEVAAQEAIEMQEAAELDDAPGLAKVEPTLAAAWSESARISRKRNWFRFSSVIGIAAAILAVVLLRGGGEPPRDGPRGDYLGGADFELAYPPERAERWDRIGWTGSKDATYKVLIRDARTGAVLLGPTEINAATELSLPPEVTASWPDKITIEVERREKDGTWVAAPSRDSELAP